MKFRSLAAILMLLCILAGSVACGKKDTFEDMHYESVDYMALDLSPYIKMGEYKGIEVKVKPFSLDDSSIEEDLQNMIASKTTFNEYAIPVTDRVTEAGDYVEINFKGYLDGELFEGGSADGAAIMLADNNGYVDWLEDDLYGVMPGTTVQTTGTFPEDYHYSEFAGKEVTFEIKLISIKGHYTIPTLDDAFIAENTEYETLEEYRTTKYNALLAEAEKEYENVKIEAMWEAVMKKAEIIELVEDQVMFYYSTYRRNANEYAQMYDYTYEEYLAAVGIEDSEFKENAEALVKQEMIFYAIVKAEGYTVTDEDYAKGVKELAEGQGMTVEELEQAYDKAYISDNILWDNVMRTLTDLTVFVTE